MSDQPPDDNEVHRRSLDAYFGQSDDAPFDSFDGTDDSEPVEEEPKKKRGRPRLLTEQVQNDLITALQKGSNYVIACGYAGISYGAFNLWMTKGRAEHERIEDAYALWESLEQAWENAGKPKGEWVDGDQIYVGKPKKPKNLEPSRDKLLYYEFFKAITEAMAVADVNWLGVIDTQATQDAHWAAWMLGKRHPETYGPYRQQPATLQVKASATPATPSEPGHVEIDIRIDDMTDTFREIAEYERQLRSQRASRTDPPTE